MRRVGADVSVASRVGLAITMTAVPGSADGGVRAVGGGDGSGKPWKAVESRPRRGGREPWRRRWFRNAVKSGESPPKTGQARAVAEQDVERRPLTAQRKQTPDEGDDRD